MTASLLRYFKPHKKLFIIDMICAVVAAGVDLSFPLISRHSMYHLLPDKKFHLFFVLMFTIFAFYVIRALCFFVMTYIGHTFGVRVETDIRRDLFKHMQQLDFEFYDKNRTGQLMSRLTGDLFEITELAHHGPEDIVISLFTIIGALGFMFHIEWRLALIVAVLLPIFILIVMSRRKKMSEASIEVKRKLAEINSDIESCISGIRTGKAFANEAEDLERFSSSNLRYRDAKTVYYKSMGGFISMQEFFMGIIPVTVIAFGGFLIMDNRLNYIELITFTLFVGTFITPIRKLSNFSEIFINGSAGLKRFSEIMAIEPDVHEKSDAEELKVNEGSIDINNISFSYNGKTNAIENIDLHIKDGKTVAVVGHSGGGKTTLCRLIPRFYDVSAGSICIDGNDIRDVSKHSLRKNIGVVQQDVFIFADTVYRNILYGRPDASYDEVIEAAKRAEIFDDIMEMSQKFDTYVGERGTQLSGGQKQRISIARIFLKNPKIIILDEATSALDTITEEKIQGSFDRLSEGRTTIIIAHRLATVRNADEIVLIDKGRIMEQGTHKELIDKSGYYAALYNTQKLFVD